MNQSTLRRTAATCLFTFGIVSGAHGQCDPVEAQKLLDPGGNGEDQFGLSVSLHGLAALIGAPVDDRGGLNAGAASVFRFDGMQWMHEANLRAGDASALDRFGQSVALDGDTAMIGASGDGDSSGSVYIFEHDGAGNWVQIDKLAASDGAAFDRFGHSTAISGTAAVVGAYRDNDYTGSAYLFEEVSGQWQEAAKLLASDGAASDQFGFCVAIDGSTAIIGASGDDSRAGAAYVFERIDGQWQEAAKLSASDGGPSRYFGRSVAISGGEVVIGAIFGNGNAAQSGAAYIFEKVGGQWREIAKLIAHDGASYDNFGHSVAISGDSIIVGATSDQDNGPYSGSAYVFRHDGSGAWVEAAKLIASDGAQDDEFGRGIAVLGETALIGAAYHNANGVNAGAAYIFDLNCTCPADFNDDGIVNTLDFIAYLNAYNVGDPRADMNGDGIVNTLDFIAFLNAYSEGC